MPLPNLNNLNNKEKRVNNDYANMTIEELRNTEKWKRYYEQTFLNSTTKVKLTQKQKEEYIDKLVRIPTNSKNPFQNFDVFWKERNK